MKVLVYKNRLGPAVVFLPPKRGQAPESAAVPADEKLLAPARAQVAAIGRKTTWARHCALLVASPPYAGSWSTEEVPDGYSAAEALAAIRQADSSKSLGAGASPERV